MIVTLSHDRFLGHITGGNNCACISFSWPDGCPRHVARRSGSPRRADRPNGPGGSCAHRPDRRGSGGRPGRRRAAGVCRGGLHRLVVAHPDDDLFFQNPDIRTDIVARKCVHTVYVTSGDAGAGAQYSRNREKGVQAAYAKMAGVANLWLPVPLKVGSQTITSTFLVFAPRSA